MPTKNEPMLNIARSTTAPGAQHGIYVGLFQNASPKAPWIRDALDQGQCRDDCSQPADCDCECAPQCPDCGPSF